MGSASNKVIACDNLVAEVEEDELKTIEVVKSRAQSS
jgi:hypothetical protein